MTFNYVEEQKKDYEFYMYTVPDSQYFTELEQLLTYAKAIRDKYLEIAIKNTIDKGYKLMREGDE